MGRPAPGVGAVWIASPFGFAMTIPPRHCERSEAIQCEGLPVWIASPLTVTMLPPTRNDNAPRHCDKQGSPDWPNRGSGSASPRCLLRLDCFTLRVRNDNPASSLRAKRSNPVRGPLRLDCFAANDNYVAADSQ
ncbi:MAG: hypothetical protein LBT00_08160 [Spirochaetaceae bacterium]|nr:hypothetical protein [Spirochaetaceae bacterium]